MKKNIFVILMMTFLVFGCASPMTQAPLPTEPRTSPPQPTWTVLPTAGYAPTPLPTATQPPEIHIVTPEPPLRTNGPYFAYFRKTTFSPFQFVLMDADGRGRKVIDLPDEVANSLETAYYQLDARYVSPDGKWLAFYTGYAGRPYGYGGAPQSTFDLTLNLLDLNTGEIQIITPLLSSDYPSNFVEAAKDIDPQNLTADNLQITFLAGITQALAWSPDGKHLAFAGQMAGLSSDLYLYDLATKRIKRLSSDKEELQWVAWSSDGKWILYGNRLVNDLMGEYSVYSVAWDNSSIRNLGYQFAAEWLNSHEILEYRMGIERYQLRSVDIPTGKSKEIWQGSFGGYSIDPTGKWILLSAISSSKLPAQEEPDFVPGLRLINLKSLEKIRNFDTSSDFAGLFMHAKDGTVINLSDTNIMVLASPDVNYWAAVGPQGIKIYTYDLVLVKENSIQLRNTKLSYTPWSPDDMQWSPDSSGLFLIYGTNICFVNISSGDVRLVETNFTGVYHSAKWIDGK